MPKERQLRRDVIVLLENSVKNLLKAYVPNAEDPVVTGHIEFRENIIQSGGTVVEIRISCVGNATEPSPIVRLRLPNGSKAKGLTSKPSNVALPVGGTATILESLGNSEIS